VAVAGHDPLRDDGARREREDRHLAEREFIALDRFTIADIVAVVGLDFARLVRYRPPAEFENLHRWFDACRERPAAKAGV
jgi:glutathione S-transferase